MQESFHSTFSQKNSQVPSLVPNNIIPCVGGVSICWARNHVHLIGSPCSQAPGASMTIPDTQLLQDTFVPSLSLRACVSVAAPRGDCSSPAIVCPRRREFARVFYKWKPLNSTWCEQTRGGGPTGVASRGPRVDGHRLSKISERTGVYKAIL